MPFNGVRNATQAIVGAPARDELVRQAEARRLTSQANQQALLDKRVADAAIANRQNDFGAQLAGMIDQTDPLAVAAMAELAGQFSSAEQARGRVTQNTAREEALNRILGGNMDADVQNALLAVAGDKLMSPGNVNVADQANADLDAARALAENRRRPSQSLSRGGPPYRNSMSDTALMAMFQDPQKVMDFQSFAGSMRQVDPAYQDEGFALAEYNKQFPDGGFLDTVAIGALDAGVDPNAAVDAVASGSEAATPTADGSSAAQAIPPEQFGAEPEAGKWYVLGGKPALWNGTEWIE